MFPQLSNLDECEESEDVVIPRRRNNVWLGTSVATQEDADRNIPELLKCRDLASKLFVSVEPLVERVSLASVNVGGWVSNALNCGIDWVIVGGESGPNARPCNVEWIRDIVQQCKAASVPCFVKQLGRPQE